MSATLYPNINKVAESLSHLNISLRKCSYYRNTGRVYNGFLFISHSQFISVIPEASKPGVSKVSLTEDKLNLLIK